MSPSRITPLRIATFVTAFLIVACGRAPEIVGVVNPAVPTAAVPELRKHKMFVAATRTHSGEAGVLFSSGRAAELGLASVVATVPPNHKVGELERPEKLPPDPRTEFTVIEPTVYRSEQSFISAIDSELDRQPAGSRRMMLFVHGYNNNFSEAALRLAQFVEDTNYPGVPMLLTWASAANPVRYVYDLNSALIARGKLKEISSLLHRTDVDSVDIFAHSMGTLLTMEGLVDAQKAGTLGHRTAINNIVLASPDIDIDLFRTQIRQLPPEIRSKIFLLVSRDDRALLASRRLAGGVPRVGAANTAELEGMGVTVIDLSTINDSSSGSHSKFAGSPEVVRMIGLGLNRSGGLERGRTPAFDRLLENVPIIITQ